MNAEEPLTVAELIETLQALPGDLPVIFHDGEFGQTEITDVQERLSYSDVRVVAVRNA